jgi:hypothetical protein
MSEELKKRSVRVFELNQEGDRTAELSTELAYFGVRTFYDWQDLRISSTNRLRDLVRKTAEGIPLDKVEEKKEANKYDKKYSDENIANVIRKIQAEGKIAATEAAHIEKLFAIAKRAHETEQEYKDVIESMIREHPLWIGFLSKIKGIGVLLAGSILASFDPYQAKHPSSFWKFAGLHVVDGKAPKRSKGQITDYNPKARTLCWKIADSFVKQRTPEYRPIYDRAKAFYLARHKEHGCTLKPPCKSPNKHSDLQARRKMTKEFLADLWTEWRKVEGLPTSPKYSARFHPEAQEEEKDIIVESEATLTEP